jgi:hypothetical protein
MIFRGVLLIELLGRPRQLSEISIELELNEVTLASSRIVERQSGSIAATNQML